MLAVAQRGLQARQPAPRRQRLANCARARRNALRVNCSRTPQGNDSDVEPRRGVLNEALRFAGATWSRLDTQQRIYTVVAGTALLASAPTVITLLLVPLERVLIGGLLAVEEVLASLLLASARLAGLTGLVALAAAGVYVFLLKKRSNA